MIVWLTMVWALGVCWQHVMQAEQGPLQGVCACSVVDPAISGLCMEWVHSYHWCR